MKQAILSHRACCFFFRAQSHYYFFAENYNWSMSPYSFHSYVVRELKALKNCSLNNSWRACLYGKVCTSQDLNMAHTPLQNVKEEFVCL